MRDGMWMETIPSHWQVAPFGFLFTQRKDKNKSLARDFVLSVVKNKGVIPYTEKGNIGNKVSENLSGYKLVNKGDFVLNSMNLYMGSVGVSAYDGITSTAYIVCQPSPEIESSYYKYIIHCRGFQEYVGLLGNGIMEIREAVRWTALKSVNIPIPPKDAQKEIAHFLDHNTAYIDKLIEKKQRLIVVLQEKQANLINHAIRQGIQSNPTMKRINFPGIELIPERWEVKKLRYLGSLQNGISEGAGYFGEGYPFVSYGDVYNNFILPANVSGLAKSSDIDRKRYSVLAGDVFFTRTSEVAEEIGISSVCLGTIYNATFSGFLIRFRPNTKTLLPNFSKYYFRSDIPRIFFVKEMNLVTRVSLSQGLLKSLPVIIPPIEEQEEISRYLDTKMAQINLLIKKIEHSINQLKEFRISLITEGVTGQLDINSWEKRGTIDKRLDNIEEAMRT
ncbi:restriction endonuclease subunit S [Legionella pneumophila]|uniref:restriction endonuclease subunit S n=1 Tax=Legionella pneumophila TaxID=446 RepID=UPI00101F1236|nr:restriction endonuclease subunit S [Legionella pneumophila]RYW86678.1 restriction endonuclease subunit S [Legionella pneumophila]